MSSEAETSLGVALRLAIRAEEISGRFRSRASRLRGRSLPCVSPVPSVLAEREKPGLRRRAPVSR
ncbi:MAG: hypothetical protein AVDCRST_MAG42-882 [uncultured Chthoniobacterales bacterium]|uniref:Uncharacterized protein n=1 Tax=uncultured Chthoniobacterales bacterium TaxID=1836801 RepID=A0A6J4HKW0_9BACT|nr:MAG: hypothetical protein AVDCRST_MAG42-882 [uncultured Chthoniobacterales bacterium]